MNGTGMPPPPDLRWSELEEATRAVAAEVAAGKPGVVLARGPGGFALLCGLKSEKVQTIPGGVMVVFALDRGQLAAWGARIQQLLRGGCG